MSGIARLGAVAVDCTDPGKLAAFYSGLTGWQITYSSADFAAVSGAGIWLTMHRIADHRPPPWPDPAVPKQLHLDFSVDDLDDAEARALALGATKADTQPSPDRWRVLIDPEGHPFCLSTMVPSP